ncbi:MAG: hypothetical protein LBI04_05440 [Treponema sp.]|nr:hypothetical protein [Treponema sp.]
MNDIELRKKVHSTMYMLIKNKGVVSPVDVLMEIGVLSKEKYEDWRFGRVSYLERVCQINLSKLSTINHEIRVFAQKNNLKPSWTDYRKWGKGTNTRLRFSKSGNEQIERLYATHYVSGRKVDEAKERRAAKKNTDKDTETENPV